MLIKTRNYHTAEWQNDHKDTASACSEEKIKRKRLRNRYKGYLICLIGDENLTSILYIWDTYPYYTLFEWDIWIDMMVLRSVNDFIRLVAANILIEINTLESIWTCIRGQKKK
jgi:hypothetical protein